MSKKKDNSKSLATSPSKTPPQYPSQKRVILSNIPRFDWSQHRFPLLILGVLAFGLYAASLSFGYALDDTMVIEKNQFVQKGFAGMGDIFRYESFRGYFGEQKQLLEGDRYRPFSLATFAAEIGLFGKDKTFFGHFFNLLLYALTAVLLFRVLLFMFPKEDETADETQTSSLKFRAFLSVPFLATALFIAHPLHVGGEHQRTR
jgi:protein O-mannosyl-transferase